MPQLEPRLALASPTLRTSGLAGLAVLAVLALAMVLRQGWPLAADVSWLLTVGERMSEGAVLYRDLLEVNPPASVMLYLPALAVGRLAGIAPELAVEVLIFGLAVICTMLFQRILRGRSETMAGQALTTVLILAALLILPAYAFAQREHVATMLVLPMLAAFVRRRAGITPPLPAALLAGLLGGIGVAIKPYFAPALLLPAAYALAGTRGPRLRTILNTETIAAGTVVVAYALVVLLCFPEFAGAMLPMVLAVYAPAKLTILQLAANPALGLCVATFALQGLLMPQRFRDPENLILMLASLGFMVSALIQGKGWPYHTYPAVALALIAAARGLIRSGETGSARRSAAAPLAVALPIFTVVLAIEAVGARILFADRFAPTEAIAVARQLSPPRPKVLLIGGDISAGHPLVRAIGGRWVDAACSRWLTGNASTLLKRSDLDPAERRRLEAYAALDRALLLAAIRDRVPDLILVQGDGWRQWADADPDIRAALAPYAEGARVDDIALMLRRPPAHPAPQPVGIDSAAIAGTD